MISYAEAQNIIAGAAAQHLMREEEVSLAAIPGRICAVDVIAPRSNQPFDNSAMDGFALRVEDIRQAANDRPVRLQMIGHLAAGGAPGTTPVGHGQCYEIMTGAPVPEGCDAVVPVEVTRPATDGGILFRMPAVTGDNIRKAGSDFSLGNILIRRGMRLSEEHILILATAGISRIRVFGKINASFVSTGLEIVDTLDAPLAPGQIYNATGPYLAAALAKLGLAITPLGTVRDDPADFRQKLSSAMSSDIIISTGAVSAGVHDFIPGVLKELEADILFHKVAIRPGKPVLFAKFRKGPFFFGLPGNPVSTAAGLRFFIRPLLDAMNRQPPERPQRVILAASYSRVKTELRFFLRAAGTEEIMILPNQQSFMVSPFAHSDAWAIVPEGTASLRAGEMIEIYR